MIIKYVYNNELYCIHYDNYKSFLKECCKPEFKDVVLKSKDVIVLENNGNNDSYNSLLELYQKYRKMIIELRGDKVYGYNKC